MEDRLARLLPGDRKEDSVKPFSQCHNFDFAFAWAAAMERLWSIANYVTNTQRRGMTPQPFEAVLFLSENRQLWDDSTVVEAINAIKTDRFNEWMNWETEEDLQG